MSRPMTSRASQARQPRAGVRGPGARPRPRGEAMGRRPVPRVRRRSWRSRSAAPVAPVPRAGLTTFWLARCGVSRRAGEVPVRASRSRQTSAASTIAPPTRGDGIATRLPASARSAGQAWAAAQFGRDQNVSSRAERRDVAISPASQRAARRSASVPAPRPAKRVREATVSAAAMGSHHSRAARIVYNHRVPVTASEQDLLALARRAAAAAAEILVTGQGAVHRVQAKSSPTDPVSETDVAAERAIRDVLADEPARRTRSSARRAARPATASCAGSSTRSTGRPTFSTASRSMRSAWPARTPTGRSPASCSTPCAARSSRPRARGRPSSTASTSPARTTMSSPPRWSRPASPMRPQVRARQAEVLTRVLPRVRDIRRAGAAALDLAWCACGRYDAYWERGVKPWDVAAGGLIAARAGLELALVPGPGRPRRAARGATRPARGAARARARLLTPGWPVLSRAGPAPPLHCAARAAVVER